MLFEQSPNQKQQFLMSHLMKRAFLILQMTNIELYDFLISQIEKNPILKINLEKTKSFTKQGDALDPFYKLKYKPSLFEHLYNQGKENFKNPKELFIAENIIGNLDKKGYFTQDLDLFSKDLNIAPLDVIKILKIIQSFDPKGIAAINLQQRLLLQIDDVNSIEYKLLKDHFEDILKNRTSSIAKKLKKEPKIIQKNLEKIISKATFDPTIDFLKEVPNQIVPDIVIQKREKKWVIEIEENLPFFEINDSYVKFLENEKINSSKKYLFSANLLMTNIITRRKTLYQISAYIIKKQKSYLIGKTELIPMTIKEIALFLNLHPSTVSRAISNKYIQTPIGLLAIASFFSFRKETPLTPIEKTIEEIIDTENKQKPLTDLEIFHVLKEKGFDIQRRTIAKYRKKRLIGPARLRKKY